MSSVEGNKSDEWEETGKGREEGANEGGKQLRSWPCVSGPGLPQGRQRVTGVSE